MERYNVLKDEDFQIFWILIIPKLVYNIHQHIKVTYEHYKIMLDFIWKDKWAMMENKIF